MRHLISPLDFSVDELEKLLKLASDIEKNPEKYCHACDGKKIATLFYEPSTRTRLSFEAAMINLGGQVLGFSSADSSSAAKGESISDTMFLSAVPTVFISIINSVKPIGMVVALCIDAYEVVAKVNHRLPDYTYIIRHRWMLKYTVGLKIVIHTKCM